MSGTMSEKMSEGQDNFRTEQAPPPSLLCRAEGHSTAKLKRKLEASYI